MPKNETRGHEQFGHPFRMYLIVSDDSVLPQKVAVGVPLTDRKTESRPWWIDVDPADLRLAQNETGLEKPSTILVDQIRVIDFKSRVMPNPKAPNPTSRVGTISEAIQAQVDRALLKLLGL